MASNDNSPIAFFWNSDPKHTAEAAAEYQRQQDMTPDELEVLQAENLAKSEAWIAEQQRKQEEERNRELFAQAVERNHNNEQEID